MVASCRSCTRFAVLFRCRMWSASTRSADHRGHRGPVGPRGRGDVARRAVAGLFLAAPGTASRTDRTGSRRTVSTTRNAPWARSLLGAHLARRAWSPEAKIANTALGNETLALAEECLALPSGMPRFGLATWNWTSEARCDGSRGRSWTTCRSWRTRPSGCAVLSVRHRRLSMLIWNRSLRRPHWTTVAVDASCARADPHLARVALAGREGRTGNARSAAGREGRPTNPKTSHVGGLDPWPTSQHPTR